MLRSKTLCWPQLHVIPEPPDSRQRLPSRHGGGMQQQASYNEPQA